MTFFYSAFSTSNAMFLAMPGEGSQYVGGFYDADRDRPMGEHTYVLHIPRDVPVVNYWSIAVYDAETRCLVDNGTNSQSIASNQAINVNGFFLAYRFYGPTQDSVDRAWTPGDLSKSTCPGSPQAIPGQGRVRPSP